MTREERVDMLAREWEDLRAYADKLRSYTTEELEDIYFHIHILRQPLRYRLLIREMESRRLRPGVVHSAPARANLRTWLETCPWTASHPVLRAVLLSMLLFIVTTTVTFGLLAPIWLFALPLRFLGLQTALVYFACAPIPPIMGAALGGKMGGRGVYSIWVLMGVAAALLLFNATGAPSAILRTILEPQGAGGMVFSGF